jgi:hypothetical protein
MNDELAIAVDIAGGVLQIMVDLVLQPEHDQRRIFGKDIEKAERSSVDRAVFVKRRHQRDGARHHHPAKQLVAVERAQVVERNSGHFAECPFDECPCTFPGVRLNPVPPEAGSRRCDS